MDKAMLTGGSAYVAKQNSPYVVAHLLYQDKGKGKGKDKDKDKDKGNTLFSSTIVTVGKGRTVAVGVGSVTAMGKIHDAIFEPTTEATPLKRKPDEFGAFLARAIACVRVLNIGLAHIFNPCPSVGWGTDGGKTLLALWRKPRQGING